MTFTPRRLTSYGPIREDLVRVDNARVTIPARMDKRRGSQACCVAWPPRHPALPAAASRMVRWDSTGGRHRRPDRRSRHARGRALPRRARLCYLSTRAAGRLARPRARVSAAHEYASRRRAHRWTWTQHAQYGWPIQVRTAELTDRVDRRGTVAFRGACTRHLGPVRATEAVERFGDRVFEVTREQPRELCAIKGITPERPRAIQDSFAAVASIANVDSWLRHLGLGKADARRVREVYGPDAAELVRETRTGWPTRSTASAF
jgi:hypothetical protein